MRHPAVPRVGLGIVFVTLLYAVLGPFAESGCWWHVMQWLAAAAVGAAAGWFAWPALGLDLTDPDGNPLPYSTSKDGFGAFTALAGFAVAQGVALTAVARDERRDWISILIYCAAVAVTAGWTATMLRAHRDEPVPNCVGVGTVAARAFDRPSSVYGRWTLGWIVIVGVILVVLAKYRLLPNQTLRVAYVNDDVPCQPHLIGHRDTTPLVNNGGTADDRLRYDLWIREWVAKTRDVYTPPASTPSPLPCRVISTILTGGSSGRGRRSVWRRSTG